MRRCYAAENTTDLLQAVNLTGLLQLVNNLQQTCQSHQVATSVLKSALLQLAIGDLLQFVETTCGKPKFDNQLASRLLTTCNRLVVNKL